MVIIIKKNVFGELCDTVTPQYQFAGQDWQTLAADYPASYEVILVGA